MLRLPCSDGRSPMISTCSFRPASSGPSAAPIGSHYGAAGNPRQAGRVMIKARLVRFVADEDGAVTVDWLALTAAVVGVGLLGVNIVGRGTADASAEITAALRTAELGSITFLESSPAAGSTGSDASVGSLAP